jgi:hypothetical protein
VDVEILFAVENEIAEREPVTERQSIKLVPVVDRLYRILHQSLEGVLDAALLQSPGIHCLPGFELVHGLDERFEILGIGLRQFFIIDAFFYPA